jgi:hypothetical protein
VLNNQEQNLKPGHHIAVRRKDIISLHPVAYKFGLYPLEINIGKQKRGPAQAKKER